MSTPERQHSQSGEDSTTERAIHAVADIVERGGDHALRLSEVSRRSRVSVGSIYHHFGSREGLVDATREWLFRRSIPAVSPKTIDELLAVTTPEQFLERFERALDETDSKDGALGRQRRLLVLGAAAGRAEHYPGVVEIQTEWIDTLERLVVSLQDRGWFPKDIDARSFANYLHAVLLGRAFAEFDKSPFDEAMWRDIVMRTIAGLMSESINAGANGSRGRLRSS